MQQTQFNTNPTKMGHRNSFDKNTENDTFDDVEAFMLVLIKN
jgi:hypothetical protein